MAKQLKVKVDPQQHIDLFYGVIDILMETHSSRWQDIADNADVCLGTLYRWVNYETSCPHLRTVFNVAWALGYEIRLVKKGAKLVKPKLRIVK